MSLITSMPVQIIIIYGIKPLQPFIAPVVAYTQISSHLLLKQTQLNLKKVNSLVTY